MSTASPIVGIPACRKFIAPHPYHAVGEKYLSAVATAARATPLLIPALGQTLDIDGVLNAIDGLLLTGSPSNVEPEHYGGEPSRAGTLHDPHRDMTTLPLIPQAVAAGMPLLALCRGFQELNVAFGGTLHQRVHEVAGLGDHREDTSAALDIQYAPAHEVVLAEGGLLASLARAARASVNSLHGQGIATLGNGLAVEATAPDGLIEAFTVARADGFALGVQWHPEWQVMDNPFYRAIFEAFGRACRARAAARAGHERHSTMV